MLILLGPAGFSVYINYLERQLAQVQQQLHVLQPAVAKAQAIREENYQTKQQIISLQSLLNEKISWGEIMEDIGYAMPKDLWLTGLKAEETGAISLQGNSRSFVSIGLLQEQLEYLPQIIEVTLMLAERINVDDDSYIIRFEIIGRLYPGGDEKGVGKTVP